MKEPIDYCVVGANGCIGGYFADYLEKHGKKVRRYTRSTTYDAHEIYKHVLFAAGLTSDFREKISETYEAHVAELLKCIKTLNFSSFIYLSSTRLYKHSESTSESTEFKLNPLTQDHTYAISKLAGESICLNLSTSRNIKVVRLSNVVAHRTDEDLFLNQLLSESIRNKRIELRSNILDEKDYIDIGDVTRALVDLFSNGDPGIYNIACGTNTPNIDLIRKIQEILNIEIFSGLTTGESRKENAIDIKKIKNTINFSPKKLMDYFPEFLATYKENYEFQSHTDCTRDLYFRSGTVRRGHE